MLEHRPQFRASSYGIWRIEFHDKGKGMVDSHPLFYAYSSVILLIASISSWLKLVFSNAFRFSAIC